MPKTHPPLQQVAADWLVFASLSFSSFFGVPFDYVGTHFFEGGKITTYPLHSLAYEGF